ncbi:hypothetical protein PV327_006737 [Microctonus hyperodae]|uniref:Cap-specific mRNA (nucleoside-2'-O-)-methyltransferase 1 n=1 Tax=Microctonus hyperodae TaxID=165561 RepID=A0AA39F524_MICHY|nr:hypothetical protein PV327_006737 [Microctonus hyperodae]
MKMPIGINMVENTNSAEDMNSSRLSEDSNQSENEHGLSFLEDSLMYQLPNDYFSPDEQKENTTISVHQNTGINEEEEDERAVENQHHINEGSSPSETITKSSPSNDKCVGSNKRSRTQFEIDNHETRGVYFEPPRKKEASFGMKVMTMMGYQKGRGLGKNNQGRLEPVVAFHQKGRRGFAFEYTELKEAVTKWDPSLEVVEVDTKVKWMINELTPPSEHEMKDWIQEGEKKNTIDDETLFCDKNILQQIIKSKSIFDKFDKHEMRRARTRSNPFETIRGVFFQNRAAVKMAEMDKACDFMFTRPNGLEMHNPLYFADVCAGPGGFSEYVLWRRKWIAKGFGFTLRNSNDFKLEEFFAGPPETFHPYYGPKEDGNIYDTENQKALANLIMQQTKGQGVHFMMADGGFSVEGKENIQELLSKQLYLCQCLVALMIVREGGHFVTKLFDLFTTFSAGLIYLMSRCFKKISIFKPNTSRPANSERYLICQEKLPNINDVIAHLQHANEILLDGNKETDLVQLVPLEILQKNELFYQYLKESNDTLGNKQINGLLKIAAYCENIALIEERQSSIRTECLLHWELPDQSRTVPRYSRPEDRLQTILGSKFSAISDKAPHEIAITDADNTVCNPPCNWLFFPSAYNKSMPIECQPTLYYGMGRTRVHRLVKGTWHAVTGIELPPDTLVYAEMITEYRSEGKKQMKTHTLYIVDAWLLGAQDISQKFLPDRQYLIHQFCETLWKPTNNSFARVRPGKLHSLDEDMTRTIPLKSIQMKNGLDVMAYYPPQPSYSLNLNNDNEPFYYIPSGIIFMNFTRKPWSVHLSRSTGLHYFFNSKTNDKVYNDKRPQSAEADFSYSFEKRIILDVTNNESSSINLLNTKTKAKCCIPPRQ